MSKYVEVIAVVEGKTEQIFIEKIVKPYLAAKGIFISATQISKPGQKGGDVKFARAEKDIGSFLKQRKDIFVTTFFDYYGIKEWPNLDLIQNQSHTDIAALLNDGAVEQLKENYTQYNLNVRFIPFMAMHEFEALLFSEPSILARALNVKIENISEILSECVEPEKINSSRETAPSKRLNLLKSSGKYKKVTEGIAIADQIGIDKMREKCPLFHQWINSLEQLVNI